MRNTQDLSGYGQEQDDERYDEKLTCCQHAEGANNAKGYDECGDAAAFRVRWGNGEWLYLCEKHYSRIDNS